MSFTTKKNSVRECLDSIYANAEVVETGKDYRTRKY
jgi:hypothetical protein